jgi:DNA-directed RNA polymerase subunit RPC12/RpoP
MSVWVPGRYSCSDCGAVVSSKPPTKCRSCARLGTTYVSRTGLEATGRRRSYTFRTREPYDHSRYWFLKTNARIKKYGITVRDYVRLLAAQDYKCGICGHEQTTQELDVDHDHTTGKVRGLLCRSCNRAIGLIGEANLAKAVEWCHDRRQA